MFTFLTRTFTPITLVFSLILSVGCTKPKADDPLYIISGTASNEVAAQGENSAAIGSIKGIYNPITHKIAYNITWNNLPSEAVSAYFYNSIDGASISNRFFSINIPEAAKNGVLAGHFFLAEEQANALLELQWNYAICTSSNSNGELKGRIIVVKP